MSSVGEMVAKGVQDVQENGAHEHSSNSGAIDKLALPPSDDEQQISDEDGFDAQDAESMLGVSIGREQSRLISPSTPAAEKSAALDQLNSWGFFDGPDEDGQEEVLRNTLANTDTSVVGWEKPQSNGAPSHRVDSPHRNSWFANLRGINRSRASSSPHDWSVAGLKHNSNSFFGDGSLRRFLPNLTLGSSESPATKHRHTNSTGTSGVESTDFAQRRGRSSTLFQNKSPWRIDIPSKSPSRPSSQMSRVPRRKLSAATPPLNEQSQSKDMPRPALRRSISLGSFKPPLSRQSTASLLADEPDWGNVTQQVNSRRKAIKDTLQDSLPQMPNLNLSQLRPDLAFKQFWDPDRSTAQVNGQSNSQSFKEQHRPTLSGTRSETPPRTNKSKCPSLDAALEHLVGDVVILGGYRGSILREAEAPNRQLWVPVKVGLGVRKVNLEVGLNPQDEEEMHERIFASGMLTHIGPVDMSRRLFRKLRNCEHSRQGKLRVWDYGYDWRLSPHLLSRRLIGFLETLQCNQGTTGTKPEGAIVIAHSLGGLITRHAANQRPELFSGIVYAGTPQHCVNILGPLRNGDDVLLSSKVLTAQVNFSFRTSFLLLPDNGHCFVDKETKKEYHVDFFDAENWKRYALSPCVATASPAFNPADRKSILGSLYSALPSLLSSNTSLPLKSSSTPDGPVANKMEHLAHLDEGTVSMQMQPAVPAARLSTLPHDVAMAYLRRTLAEVRQFRQELQHKPQLEAENRYPPHALMYSISVPTVYGARVASRDAIKHSDAYDDLAFASGDGVVLARAAMMPRGYKTVRDGRVRTERGHVSLLADLEAVGKCLVGLRKGREQGVGLGTTPSG